MDSTMSPKEQRSRKNRRSRFGCKTCRARKVKCDERPDGCGNCERLRLVCFGYNTSSRAGQTPSEPAQRRTSASRTHRSCNSCRDLRTKCSGERPVCGSCREKKLECSYLDRPKANDDAPSECSVLTPGSNGQPPLSWLNSVELPEPKHIRVLVASYFQNFHPLRCFAFIHKPTFLQRVDNDVETGTKDNALLHIMCTLGAQFFALEHSDTVQSLPDSFIRLAGAHWAKRAESSLFQNMADISLEKLMTAQLLYDYALRMANFTKAFMLSAIMARMTQALQINLEYSPELVDQSEHSLSPIDRESRRRLMWSCYVTDVLCASGIDQLTLINEDDIRIQLPCNAWHFHNGHACVTRTLAGAAPAFLSSNSVELDSVEDNMGIYAYFVQHIEMRRRVLRYIKHLKLAQAPWLPGSEFATLDQELQQWFESLPRNLTLSKDTIYDRMESNQLGALCLLHCAYHQTMCDLYRLGVPALYKLRSAFHFPPDQKAFQRELQWRLFKEARTLSAIIAEGERRSPRIIGDTWLPTIAYDSNRIMLYYLTQIDEHDIGNKKELILQTIPYLQSNLNALRVMRALNVVADDLFRAAENMLDKLGVNLNDIHPWPNVVLDDPYLARIGKPGYSVPGTPPQSAPDYKLNPLSIFRMARNEVPERHAPEQNASPVTEGPTDFRAMVGNNRASARSSELVLNEADLDEAMQGSIDFDNLEQNIDMFFSSDLALNWDPAEMVVGSALEGDGLHPWLETGGGFGAFSGAEDFSN